MTIKIDGLFALVGLDMDGKPTVHAKLFMDKAEADRLAIEFRMIVKPVFL